MNSSIVISYQQLIPIEIYNKILLERDKILSERDEIQNKYVLLLEDNKINKKDLESLKTKLEEKDKEIIRLNIEIQCLTEKVSILEEDKITRNEKMLLGEIARTFEKLICKKLLGDKTRAYTFKTLKAELKENGKLNLFDLTKKELHIDKYKDQMINRLKEIRLNDAHPKLHNGNRINKKLLENLAEKYFDKNDLEDLKGLIDNICFLKNSDDDLFDD